MSTFFVLKFKFLIYKADLNFNRRRVKYRRVPSFSFPRAREVLGYVIELALVGIFPRPAR